MSLIAKKEVAECNRNKVSGATLLSALALLLFVLSPSVAKAAPADASLITHSLNAECSLVVVFPYDLSEDWQTLWGTDTAVIASYNDIWPATDNPNGTVTGYTNDTVGDWVTGWYNSASTSQTVSGDAVTWKLSDFLNVGSQYWYWSFPDGSEYYVPMKYNSDGTCDTSYYNIAQTDLATDFGVYNTRFDSASVSVDYGAGYGVLEVIPAGLNVYTGTLDNTYSVYNFRADTGASAGTVVVTWTGSDYFLSDGFYVRDVVQVVAKTGTLDTSNMYNAIADPDAEFFYFVDVDDIDTGGGTGDILCTGYESLTQCGTAGIEGLSFNVGYYVDTSDWVDADLRPEVILINISNSDTTQFAQEQRYILPLSTGSSTKVISYVGAVPDGEYTAQINFYNAATQSFVFNQSYITLNFTVSSGVLVSSSIVDSSNAIFPLTTEEAALYEDCGLTNLSGCINNSFKFLFYPSTDSLDSFNSAYSSIQNKIPFVYVYQASSLMSSMFNSATGTVPAVTVTTGIGDITFISEEMLAAIPFIPLMRSLIAAGLWIMLFSALYRKTLTIHDKQTVV
jgi:hypothetical protein